MDRAATDAAKPGGPEPGNKRTDCGISYLVSFQLDLVENTSCTDSFSLLLDSLFS